MYTIKKIDGRIEGIYDKAWDIAEVAEIKVKNWEGYSYEPKMTAKLLYSDYGLYIRMETDERPLLATQTQPNSSIYKDSCMEFFVRPNENDKMYFNFEFNPFGTMYLGHRPGRECKSYPDVRKKDLDVISYVDEEIWVLQFTIPFWLIDKYFGTHTKKMYANIYKCGNEALHEHYLSYYPIKSETPEYHLPEYFGEFILED